MYRTIRPGPEPTAEATPPTTAGSAPRAYAAAHTPAGRRAAVPPAGRRRLLPRWSQEVLLVLGGVLLYFGGRGLTDPDPATARAHAHDLVDLEQRLGLYHEPWLQGLVDGSHAVVTVANWVYIWGHWPVIAVTLVWLALRHPGQYRRTRNAMAVSGAIGMVVFVVYPLAPPRLAELGLLDTVTLHSEAYRVLQPPAFTNLYAAMPSLHVGWDLLMGVAIATVARRRLVRAVGCALPVLMTGAVVLTANHYLLDVVAGVACALVGIAVAARLDRVRARPLRPVDRAPRRLYRPNQAPPPGVWPARRGGVPCSSRSSRGGRTSRRRCAPPWSGGWRRSRRERTAGSASPAGSPTTGASS